jgi:NMD protein affecting ribosome stability and mRNA decay
MGLKSRFCPRCGSDANVSEGLCANCKFEKVEPKLPQKVVVRICRDCGAVNWRGIWVKTDEPPEYYLTLALEKGARLPPSAIIKKLEIKKMGRKGKVDLVFEIDDKKFEQTMQSDIYVKDSRCQDCGNVLSQDHRAIVQVRAKKNEKKILDFAEKYREFIIKIENQREGVDIYMLSKDSARHLATDLRKHFKFSSMTISHRQYSWDQSKNRPKTRINISLRQND